MKRSVQDGKESKEEYRRHVRVTQNAVRGKTGQDRAEQDRAKQSKERQNKARPPRELQADQDSAG